MRQSACSNSRVQVEPPRQDAFEQALVVAPLGGDELRELGQAAPSLRSPLPVSVSSRSSICETDLSRSSMAIATTSSGDADEHGAENQHAES